jgi:hypothetical protein
LQQQIEQRVSQIALLYFYPRAAARASRLAPLFFCTLPRGV